VATTARDVHNDSAGLLKPLGGIVLKRVGNRKFDEIAFL